MVRPNKYSLYVAQSVVSVMWSICFRCVSSLAYYVFIFNTANLSGNRYLNFAIGAALEIVVNLIIIFVMIR